MSSKLGELRSAEGVSLTLPVKIITSPGCSTCQTWLSGKAVELVGMRFMNGGCLAWSV
jgi:hypothetical protein